MRPFDFRACSVVRPDGPLVSFGPSAARAGEASAWRTIGAGVGLPSASVPTVTESSVKAI
jgi:hypothetical protein